MPAYYVNGNAQSNGDHEVHREDEVGCRYPAARHNRAQLGWYRDCVGAVLAASALGYKANRCYWCANPCHTG